MQTSDAIVIGGSAGSLEVLLKILPLLKANLRFTLIIVLHRKAGADEILTDLFSGRTKLPVREAQEKEVIKKGVIYLAPSDYHLLIEKSGTFSLDHSEKINYSRPSIDVTFESAADVFKDKTIGILLSGANADGVAGLKRIKNMGGRVVIQDPATAKVPYMPEQAKLQVKYDALLGQEALADWINNL